MNWMGRKKKEQGKDRTADAPVFHYICSYLYHADDDCCIRFSDEREGSV